MKTNKVDNRTLAMGHLPNRRKAMGSNPTKVHIYYLLYFSDLCFLLIRLIIELAFGTSIELRNPHSGVDRLTLGREQLTCKTGYPATHLLQRHRTETSRGNFVEASPVHRVCFMDLRSSHFSLP
jgi:hypothetical protein